MAPKPIKTPLEDLVWRGGGFPKIVKTRLELFGMPAGTTGHVIDKGNCEDGDWKVQIKFDCPSAPLTEWFSLEEYSRWFDTFD